MNPYNQNIPTDDPFVMQNYHIPTATFHHLLMRPVSEKIAWHVANMRGTRLLQITTVAASQIGISNIN